MTKYDVDEAFADPVVRCDSCSKLVRTAHVKQHGLCPHCGNRKVRNVTVFNADERELMVSWGIDPDFLKLFEPQTLFAEDGNRTLYEPKS